MYCRWHGVGERISKEGMPQRDGPSRQTSMSSMCFVYGDVVAASDPTSLPPQSSDTASQWRTGSSVPAGEVRVDLLPLDLRTAPRTLR